MNNRKDNNTKVRNMSTIRLSLAKTTQDVLNISSLLQTEAQGSSNHLTISDCVENYPHVLAYDDEQLIGFIYTNDFAPDILEIYNMFIKKDYRYQGIGTLMIQHLMNNIDKKYQGIIVINSSLYESSEEFISAVPFYNRNDFTLIATTKNTSVLYHELQGDNHE